jgi:hypothetical protein
MSNNILRRNDAYWLTVAVETSGPWPVEDVPIKFLGRDLLLIAETKELAQRVAIRCRDKGAGLAALRIALQFLSVFAWVEQCPVRQLFNVLAAWPFSLGKDPTEKPRPWPPIHQFSNIFYYDHLPEPADPRAWLAMALFREALNLDSPHYKFLSFYKIINILHKAGKPPPNKPGPSQVTWINQAVVKLDDWEAKKRLQQIQTQGVNAGTYLYESGRCAIAHAYGNPVADPDDPETTMRLSQDLPLVRALAEYAVEHEFGVKSASTVRNQHLYELAGFREIFGADLSARLKGKEHVELTAIPKLPCISIRATRDRELAEFPGLVVHPFAVEGGCVGLRLAASNGLVAIRLVLDFPGESLVFAPYHDVVCFDNETARAVQNALTSLALKRILLRNGRLEIWDSESGRCLGKTGPCIPVNIDSARTMRHQDRIRERLETMLWMRQCPLVGACDI